MGSIDQAGPSLEGKRVALAKAFAGVYGPGQQLRAFSAPGRVNLMGAHLDYNGGPVLPLAVDRHVLVGTSARSSPRVRLASLSEPARVDLPLEALPDRAGGSWSDYLVGVMHGLCSRGARPRGVDLLVGGDLPVGAGLSSSAALCLAAVQALGAVWECELEPGARVEVALEAEREFVHVPCGSLDPLAIAFARPGHALWLETKSGAHESLPLDLSKACLAVVDSRVRRRLATSGYRLRVDECSRALAALRNAVPRLECLADVDATLLEQHRERLDAIVCRRVEHVVGEVARTREARAALEFGDLAALGSLMTRSHRSLRDLFEVSCDELDVAVEAASRVEGVHGGRMMGAGFGGCAAFLLEAHAREAFEAEVLNAHRARFQSAPGVWFLRDSGPPRELAS